MSLSHALSNALSGLTASSRMAEIVSANLANVLTDGYGRRSVELSAQTIGGRGAGVTIDGISRRTDRAMIADRRTTESALSRQETLAKTLTRLETAVGVTGDDTALGGRIAALEQALVAASADPGSDIRLAAVVADASSSWLTAAFLDQPSGARYRLKGTGTITRRRE